MLFCILFIQATAEANGLIMYNDYMHLYSDSMQDALNNAPFLSPNELSALHNKTKNETITQVQHL